MAQDKKMQIELEGLITLAKSNGKNLQFEELKKEHQEIILGEVNKNKVTQFVKNGVVSTVEPIIKIGGK